MVESELAAGVYVFNHTAVDDVVAALIKMHPSELRMVAVKLAQQDAVWADEFALTIMDVVCLPNEPNLAIWAKVSEPIKAKITERITRPEFSIDYDDYEFQAAVAQ